MAGAGCSRAPVPAQQPVEDPEQNPVLPLSHVQLPLLAGRSADGLDERWAVAGQAADGGAPRRSRKS